MKEIYDWTAWFRELAERIAEGGEASLIEKARQVDWSGEPELLKHGDQGIDPFSFIYALAQKNTRNQRPRVYSSVAERFGLTSPLPDLDNEDFYVFPTPPPLAAALFHDSENFSPELLWRLFGQAVKDEPRIDRSTFRDVLEIRYVGLVKLTHTLCLINPNYFVPTDALQHVPANEGINPRRLDYDGYMSAMDKAKQTFPGCRAYEINTFLYLQYMSTSPLLTAGSRFFQISTNAYGGRWEDFDRSNAVYTDSSRQGGPEGLWESATAGGDSRGTPYPLTEPARGDVILVRTSVLKGRAIGVVHRNDYAEPNGLNERSRLHVYWINRSEADFVPANQPGGAQTTQVAFSETTPDLYTYKAFREAAPYQPTFALIDKAKPNGGNRRIDSIHPLNQILYGPPGTGKTWHTVTRAVAIIENRNVGEVAQEDRPAVKRRFDEYRRDGRIEMVTFHQNTTYEDFVEGIRPVLASGAKGGAGAPGNGRELQYELSRGVFRLIAQRAEQDPGQHYVLVIDEINRGNIARIFGELITLVEDSKRIGGEDEARVTLPSSKTSFGVPPNLHVVGTMNTADRSIALLDTALRRRFVFEEMMPDASHPGVATDVDGVDCRKLLDAMNRRIAVLLDREHQIGHTYFLGVDTLAALARTFQTRIVPLLQEYFYDDWEKIRAVLKGNGFVRKSDPPEELVRSDLVDTGRTVYELLPVEDEQWTTPKAYRAIYETKTQTVESAVQGD